jgi:hypothetical protein
MGVVYSHYGIYQEENGKKVNNAFLDDETKEVRGITEFSGVEWYTVAGEICRF